MPEPTTALVYVPTPADTLKQVNALPTGALIRTRNGKLYERDADGRWWFGLEQAPAALIGGHALVPVTATVEEQWVETYPGGGGRRLASPPLAYDYPRDHDVSRETRYTTPWTPEEEA